MRDLCKTSYAELLIFKLSDLYPSLNESEKRIASQEPLKSLRAYGLSWHAIFMCNEIYEKSDHNDESDACRHFVWAALMTHNLSKGFATKVLNAHEAEPDQPDKERKMDLLNNDRGTAAAEKLDKDGNFSESAVMAQFKQQLQAHKLMVLKPKHAGGSK